MDWVEKRNQTFVFLRQGKYEIQLVVKDRLVIASESVAYAGSDQSIHEVGTRVMLNGAQSYDPDGDGTDANGDALSYRWILALLPDRSLSEMADSSARVTTFTPDRAGVYVAQLVVSDDNLVSEPSAIQIQAFTTQTKTIAALQGLETRITELDGSAFKNADMQLMLLNKLNAVIANVEAGKHADAANQLRNDILPKMGDAGNTEGDSVVWITDRSLQPAWCQEAQDVVKALEMVR